MLKLNTWLAKCWQGTKAVFASRQMRMALTFAKQAAGSALTNDAKRAYVVTALMDHFKLPESAARLLCELAVKALKQSA